MIAVPRKLASLVVLGAAAPWLSLAPAASAHEGVAVGEYVLTIGWRIEPALVGQPNGVQLFVEHHDGGPISTGADLEVVVSTAGASTPPMALTPQFAVGESGTAGEYGVDIIPTAPGDYTFRFSGTIRGTDVDVEMTSGEDTFSRIEGASDLEFPLKLPSPGEIVTRLDRIDGRIAALQSTDPGTAALDAANAAADAARTASASATQALLVGGALGIGGIAVGLIGIALALRAGRRGANAA